MGTSLNLGEYAFMNEITKLTTDIERKVTGADKTSVLQSVEEARAIMLFVPARFSWRRERTLPRLAADDDQYPPLDMPAEFFLQGCRMRVFDHDYCIEDIIGRASREHFAKMVMAAIYDTFDQLGRFMDDGRWVLAGFRVRQHNVVKVAVELIPTERKFILNQNDANRFKAGVGEVNPTTEAEQEERQVRRTSWRLELAFVDVSGAPEPKGSVYTDGRLAPSVRAQYDLARTIISETEGRRVHGKRRLTDAQCKRIESMIAANIPRSAIVNLHQPLDWQDIQLELSMSAKDEGMTQQQEKQVEALASMGIPAHEIAMALKVDHDHVVAFLKGSAQADLPLMPPSNGSAQADGVKG